MYLLYLLQVVLAFAASILVGDLLFVGVYKRRRASGKVEAGRKTAAKATMLEISPEGEGSAIAATVDVSPEGTGSAPGEAMEPCEGDTPRTDTEPFFAKTSKLLERQDGPSCAGYAAAYVLRALGIEDRGEAAYEAMNKVYGGNVRVTELRRYLALRGVETEYVRGDVTTLREDLMAGNPIILLVRTSKGAGGLHFLVAVGFDEEYIYLVDSARPQIPGNQIYNRKLRDKDLLRIWDTRSLYMPFYRETYIVPIWQGDQTDPATRQA